MRRASGFPTTALCVAAILIGDTAVPAEEVTYDSKGLSEWAKDLESPDPKCRATAAGVIAKLGPKAAKAVPALIRALKDEHVSVRDDVVRALGAIGPAATSAAPALAEAFADKERYLRDTVFETLQKLAPKDLSAIPGLVRDVGSDAPHTRIWAAAALSRLCRNDYELSRVGIDPEPMLKALSEAASDRNVHVRRAAMRALSSLSCLGEVDPHIFLNGMKDRDDDVRMHAVLCLGDSEALCRALKDQNPKVRERAAERLSHRTDEESVGALAEALSDEEWDVAYRAASALSARYRRAKAALPALTRIVADKDEEPLPRWSAAEAIGNVIRGWRRNSYVQANDFDMFFHRPLTDIGNIEGFDHFDDGQESVSAWGDKTQGIADNEIEAAVSALAVALQGWRELRAEAARSLGRIGPKAKEAVPALIKALKHTEEPTKIAAAEALMYIGPLASEAMPALVQATGDDERRVRHAAIWALDRVVTEPARIIPPLVDLLGHENPYTRYDASLAIARRGKAAVPALVKAVADTSVPRRRAAAYALSNIGPAAKDATDALIRALTDQDAHVVWYACQALERVQPDPRMAVPVLVAVLGRKEAEPVARAAEALGSLGEAANKAIPLLLKTAKAGEERVRYACVTALARIGIDGTTAQGLAALQVPDDSRAARRIFEALCQQPEAARVFLESHPQLPAQMEGDPGVFLAILEQKDPRYSGLKEAVLANAHLPAVVMAWSGQRRFLPILKARIQNVDPHKRTYLKACARACGEPPGRIIRLPATHPREYAPPSAMGCDPKRTPPGFFGDHGDGHAQVLITGRLLMADGSPAVEPKFYNTQTRMLLGLGPERKDALPLKYDAGTGRFVLRSWVFAAYASGRGQEEPGPFQTGTLMTLIEAKGAEPLTVPFFDEMPEAEITLQPAE